MSTSDFTRPYDPNEVEPRWRERELGSTWFHAVDGVDMQIKRGEYVAIMGTSCTAHPFHDHERWPLVVAGRANGALKYPGVHFKAPYGTTSTKFTFTLMKALGYPDPTWGEGAALADSVFSEIMG